MAEYINKQALLAEYDRVHVGPPGGARKLIEEAPAADVVPVKRGRWKRMKAYHIEYVCSECGDIWPDFRSYYCPNCGARMEEGE